MTRATLARRVKRFLAEGIASVERLDVLLFMYRHAANRWTAERLADLLDMPADAVQSHLEHLTAHNLLSVQVGESLSFSYDPGRPELSELVEAVAQAHYGHRDSVVSVLAGGPPASARLFAEAFDIRKGKKRDG